MSTVTSRDGTRIAVSRAGQGPALVLVDGALCSRAFGPMPGYAKRLAGHFTVHWYDRRGRNESGDAPAYQVEREVEDLAAVLAEAGGTPYVFGTSSGAALALHGALAELPMAKLLLYEPPYLPVPPGGTTAAGHAEALWALVREDERAKAVHYFMCSVVGMPNLLGYVFRLMPMWGKLKAVAHTLPYDLTILAQEAPFSPAAQALAVPTLLAGGGKSPPPLKAAVTRVAGALPGASLRWVEGQTHNLGADAAVALMRDYFLGDVDSGVARATVG